VKKNQDFGMLPVTKWQVVFLAALSLFTISEVLGGTREV
jgi:hypothetical protein